MTLNSRVAVPHPVHEALPQRSARRATNPSQSLTLVCRVCTNLQGCRYRFRGHGFHWILRQAHPHPNVRPPTVPLLLTYLCRLYSNNILVCVSPELCLFLLLTLPQRRRMMYIPAGCWTLHVYCTYGDYLSLSFPPFLRRVAPSASRRQR